MTGVRHTARSARMSTREAAAEAAKSAGDVDPGPIRARSATNRTAASTTVWASQAASAPRANPPSTSGQWCTSAITLDMPSSRVRPVSTHPMRRLKKSTTAAIAADAVAWSEGKPLSAAWAMRGATWSTTKGRGSSQSAPARVASAPARLSASTPVRAKGSFVLLLASSQATAAPAATTKSMALATTMTTEFTGADPRERNCAPAGCRLAEGWERPAPPRQSKVDEEPPRGIRESSSATFDCGGGEDAA